MKLFQLKDHAMIPQMGFGTWQLEGDQATESVEYALEVGYRHIDTADAYSNHSQVGQGIKNSTVSREEIFLTSKVWRDKLTKDGVTTSAKRFLDELRTEYLDLLLVHWPNFELAPIAETLGAMAELKEEGIVKAIGVSNFTIHHLKDALETGIDFSVNQVEYHPSLNQQALKDFCDEHNIVVTAYSPIAQGDDLNMPVIQELAEKYEVSAAQVVLNWLMAKGLVVIPRSSNPEHIYDNFQATTWELREDDVVKITEASSTDNRIVIPSFAQFNY